MILRILSSSSPTTPSASTASSSPITDTAASISCDDLSSLLTMVLLPALSLSGANPSLSHECWTGLLKPLPYQARYRLYQEWAKGYRETSHPNYAALSYFVPRMQDVKQAMRKHSERPKSVARVLMKVGHANPLLVAQTLLFLIQGYESYCELVVEAIKFLNGFALDVLSYALVVALADGQKIKLKSDGTSTTQWMTLLTKFCGAVYRKYPHMELGGVFQYVATQLKARSSIDVLVLSEIFTHMGRCSRYADFSLEQLEKQAGGSSLSLTNADVMVASTSMGSDTMQTNQAMHPKRSRAASKLREALFVKGAETRSLFYPLVILISQVRQHVMNQKSSGMKQTCFLMDDATSMLLQMLQFASQCISPALLVLSLPPLKDLVSQYHVPFEFAMTVMRPVCRAAHPLLASTGVAALASTECPAWSLESAALATTLRTLFDAEPEVFATLTPTFVATFWTLVTYDLFVPALCYEKELARLRLEYASLKGVITTAGMEADPLGLGWSYTRIAAEIKRQEKRLNGKIEHLLSDRTAQTSHQSKVLSMLQLASLTWIRPPVSGNETPLVDTTIPIVLQKCVLPRMLLTAEDALFSAKFIVTLHAMGTPHFSSLRYYHAVSLNVPCMIQCVTEREATNLGLFLAETFRHLAGWAANETKYTREAIGNGRVGFRQDATCAATVLSFTDFGTLLKNWHKAMDQLFLACLDRVNADGVTTEFMTLKNALIVLLALVDTYPSTRASALALAAKVEVLTKDERKDLEAKAMGYSGLLQKKIKTVWKVPSTRTESPTSSLPTPSVTSTSRPLSTSGGAPTSRRSRSRSGDRERPISSRPSTNTTGKSSTVSLSGGCSSRSLDSRESSSRGNNSSSHRSERATTHSSSTTARSSATSSSRVKKESTLRRDTDKPSSSTSSGRALPVSSIELNPSASSFDPITSASTSHCSQSSASTSSKRPRDKEASHATSVAPSSSSSSLTYSSSNLKKEKTPVMQSNVSGTTDRDTCSEPVKKIVNLTHQSKRHLKKQKTEEDSTTPTPTTTASIKLEGSKPTLVTTSSAKDHHVTSTSSTSARAAMKTKTTDSPTTFASASSSLVDSAAAREAKTALELNTVRLAEDKRKRLEQRQGRSSSSNSAREAAAASSNSRDSKEDKKSTQASSSSSSSYYQSSSSHQSSSRRSGDNSGSSRHRHSKTNDRRNKW